jgi:hypothetical protein
MKRRVIISSILFLVSVFAYAQNKVNTWDLLAKTKFESKYNDDAGEYLFYPTFPADLKSMVGKDITIQGYYVPYAPEGGDYIIISKFPMNQCYFCGGGGPESVVEVTFTKMPSSLKVDDLITVKGKLKLNATDIDHVNFIVSNAVIIDE